MKVSITGRHVTVHQDVKSYAREKAARLERYFDQLREIEVILDGQGDRKSAEMIAHPQKGERIVGQAEHEDAFAAIDLLVDKMYQQLHKLKERTKDNRKRSSRVPAPPEPSDRSGEDERLESYEEVVDKFSERFDD